MIPESKNHLPALPSRLTARGLCLALLFLVLVATGAEAQVRTTPTFKLAPYAAFFLEGNFDDGEFDGDDFLDDLSLDEGEGLGLALDIRLSDSLYLELSYSEQETTLEIDEFFSSSTDLVDLDVQYLHVGLQWQWTGGQVQPFLTGSIGATRLSPTAANLDFEDDETRPSAAIGGGLEILFGERIGLRLHARALGTFIDSDEDVFCNRFGCYSYDDSETLFQVETGAGLVFRF